MEIRTRLHTTTTEPSQELSPLLGGQKIKIRLTSRERHKSAPYLRLKTSKRHESLKKLKVSNSQKEYQTHEKPKRPNWRGR